MTQIFGFSTAELALIAMVMMLAGFVKGVIAFAFPIVVIAILANIIEPAKAVALGLIPGFFTSVFQVRFARTGYVLSRFRWLLLAIFGGIWIGAGVAAVIKPAAFLVLLGLMTLAASILFWLNPRFEIAPGRQAAAGLGFGLASGIFGGLSTVFGPPVVMYMIGIGVSREDFVAAVALIFTLCWLVVIGAFGTLGLLTASDLQLSTLLTLPALFGLWLGERVCRHVDQALFRKFVLAGLAMSGLRLIIANADKLV